MSADLAAGLVVVVVVLIASGLVGYQLAEARAFARARRSTVRANPPQPEPVNTGRAAALPEYVYDPASWYDAVLLSLDQSVRGAFMLPEHNLNNTLVVEPASKPALTVGPPSGGPLRTKDDA